MRGKVFLDTNVLIYTQSESEPEKRMTALKTFEKYNCCTSTQVFNEMSNVLIKKAKMKVNEVKQIIAAVNERCEISTVTFETVQKALDIKEKCGYSYYDCLILACALLSECNYVFSEDLHDGQILDNNLEIVNVFERSVL
jgi:predicted nucleic acid-binding protein